MRSMESSMRSMEKEIEEQGFKIMQSVYVQGGHPEQEELEKEMLEMVRRQVWSNGVE